MNKSKFLKWVLAGGIVIVLNLFFNYTIALFYDSPKFEDFCKREQVIKIIKTEEECVSLGGAWTENIAPIEEPVKDGGQYTKGWCDKDYTCRQEYSKARDAYEQNVFIALVILGVLSIAVSFTMANYEAVSLGLSAGGVLSFIIGSIRYWDSAPDVVRVIILAIALASLIWLGIKKVKD